MKIEVYIVHKWIDISHCFIQLKSNFEIHIPHNISNSYASQFWTPPYVDHNIEKYQVT